MVKTKGQTANAQSIALAVVALFAGILMGIVGANLFSSSGPIGGNDDEHVISSAQLDFQVAVRDLMVEHYTLTMEHLRNVYDDADQTQAGAVSLAEVRHELATTLAAVTGSDTEERLMELTGNLETGMISYAVAARDGSAADVTEAEEAIEAAAAELAEYIAEISGLAWGELDADAEDMNAQVLRSISAHSAGNYQESYQLQRNVKDQLGTLSTALTDALVSQYPERF